MVHVWDLPPGLPSERSKHPDRRRAHPLLEPVNFKTQTQSPSVYWVSEKMLATYEFGGPIQFWTTDGQKKHMIKREQLCRFEWSPDGQTLAIQHSQQLELCSADGSMVRNSVRMPDGDFAWSKDGQRLAFLSIKMNLFVWNVHETNRPGKVVSGRDRTLTSAFSRRVQWTPDGKQLTSASRDTTIRIWDVDGVLAKSWTTPGQQVRVVSLHPSGRTLVSYSWGDRKTRFWKLDGTELPMESESETHMGIEWCPDGEQFAAPARQNAFIRFFDSSGRLVHTGRPGNVHRVRRLAWSPDGKWLATASHSERPPTIRLWRGDDSPPRILEGSAETIVSIAWHPDSQRITSISRENGEIRHWSSEGGMGDPIVAHGAGGGLQWSPDGQSLAAYSGGRVRIYDSDDHEIADLPNVKTIVRDLVWCPDSRWLAVQTDNGIQVYDLEGKLLNEFSGMRLASETAAWSPDGGKIACATIFNVMVCWDVKRGRTDWVGFPLKDGKSATVTARGELLTNDRAAFDKEYVFLQEGPDGRVVFRDSWEFEKTLLQEKP
jgi:WD40 repeat protein